MKKGMVLLLSVILLLGTACSSAGGALENIGKEPESAAERSREESGSVPQSAVVDDTPKGPVLLDLSGLEQGGSGIGVAYGMTPQEIAALFPTAGEYTESDSANGRMDLGYVTAYGAVWNAIFMFNPEKGFREVILSQLTEENMDRAADYQGIEDYFPSDGDSNAASRAAVAILDTYADLTHEYKYLDTAVYIWKLEDGTRLSCSFYFTAAGRKKSMVDPGNPEDMERVHLNFIFG